MGGDSHQAFPGHGQQGATQAEITSLRREVRKLKGGAGYLKKSRGLLRERISLRYAFIGEASRDMAAEVDVRGARCLAEWFLQLVGATAESTVPV